MLHIASDEFRPKLSADPLVLMFQTAVAAMIEADEAGRSLEGDRYHDIIDEIGHAASANDAVDIKGIIVRLGFVLGWMDRLCEAAYRGDDTGPMIDEITGHIHGCVRYLARNSGIDIHAECMGIHYPSNIV